MWAGNQYNERTYFLIGKLIVASILTAAYFTLDGPLEWTFELLNTVFATSWNAKDWRFRVALDMWIVWGGMGTALAFIKIKEMRITDRPQWPIWERWSIIAAGVTMALFFLFELTRSSKFVYNVYHPYISIFPVLAYVVLRNSTVYLRSTSSTLFIFFGQCSLETFILQFYIFLAADTKGIVMLIPGGPWIRPLNFIVTSLIVRSFFLLLSSHARAHRLFLECNSLCTSVIKWQQRRAHSQNGSVTKERDYRVRLLLVGLKPLPQLEVVVEDPNTYPSL